MFRIDPDLLLKESIGAMLFILMASLVFTTVAVWLGM